MREPERDNAGCATFRPYFSFAPTGVQRIAILRILCGHLSAFLPFFSLFRGEVSNYIAPEADLLETCPRQPAGGYFVACTAAPLPPPPGFPCLGQNKRVFPVRTPLPGYPSDRIRAESCLYTLQLTPYGQESGLFLSEAWQGAKEIRRSSR